MNVAVIAAGLPRCATSSLQEALQSEWLGCYPTMHMARVLPWPDRSQLVLDALREEDKDRRQKTLHKLFDGFAAICDFPGVAFIDDLMDMWPDAKIILNKRNDPVAWAKSIDESLMFFNSWTYRITTFPSTADRLHAQMHFAAFDGPRGWHTLTNTRKLSQRKFGIGRPRNLQTYQRWYNEHNEFVRNEARKRGQDVLEWEPQDGWAPICQFLGKPLPPASLPFPHCNDKQEMRKLKIILVARACGEGIVTNYDERESAGRNTSRLSLPNDPSDENGENWSPSSWESLRTVGADEKQDNRRGEAGKDEEDIGFEDSYDDESDEEWLEEQWRKLRQPVLPEPEPFEEVDYSPPHRLSQKFKDTGLQIIVKMVSIELTPEKPN
ncbi:hypothetical protein E0Z10_g7414 [Xylaria hypoxylon]|uniref:DUF4246 domain-containing protein n=1 Tax=Xylaria hypoxylon TaxID=37992 RepID=A0A4Z0YQN7_9PEZI|nr:hypothetical protein E0Z10_g7414 [Xylaria hypoxylon]